MNAACGQAGKVVADVAQAAEAGSRVRYTGLRQMGLIAMKEFGDRFRSGWVIVCVAVWLGAISLTSLFGLAQIGHIGWQGYERTVISLLNLVQYFVPLLGLLLGHDLMVTEREERTLPLLLAIGLKRSRLLMGKFLGGCLTLSLPLSLGFVIAGVAVGIGSRDNTIKPFLTLAVSGLVLGIIFLAAGLLISTWSRTRVQSLVFALLAWCLVVFVFDLVALGVLISTKAPEAAKEIDVACDTMHVNSATDIHAAFDSPVKTEEHKVRTKPGFTWLLVNPVDLFRAVNLSKQMNVTVPPLAVFATVAFWLAALLGLSSWKLRRLDL
jgi:Cu-processing system permease protein